MDLYECIVESYADTVSIIVVSSTPRARVQYSSTVNTFGHFNCTIYGVNHDGATAEFDILYHTLETLQNT